MPPLAGQRPPPAGWPEAEGRPGARARRAPVTPDASRCPTAAKAPLPRHRPRAPSRTAASVNRRRRPGARRPGHPATGGSRAFLPPMTGPDRTSVPRSGPGRQPERVAPPTPAGCSPGLSVHRPTAPVRAHRPIGRQMPPTGSRIASFLSGRCRPAPAQDMAPPMRPGRSEFSLRPANTPGPAAVPRSADGRRTNLSAWTANVPIFMLYMKRYSLYGISRPAAAPHICTSATDALF